MHAKSAVLALLLLFPAVAFADAIERVAPDSFYAGNPEQFLSIFGTGLAGAVSTNVVYSGPAGQFTVEASDASSTRLDVWVPVPVSMTAGRYSVDVYADDGGGVVRHIGPAFISVIEQVIEAPPLLGIPENLFAEATSSEGAVVTYTVSALSQGGTGLTYGCDHPSGSLFPMNGTTVHCTASDSFGTTTGTFFVFVGDTLPPVVSVPADITSDNPVVTFTATAVDAIDGSRNVTCSPASGSTFPLGTTNVKCFATDEHANYGFASFNVTVTGGAAPVLHLPADMTVEATSPQGAFVSYTATADGGTIQCSPASGSQFALGTTTVSCSATNVDGTTTGTFTVTVVDTTAPEIVRLTPTPENLWPPNHKMTQVVIEAVVFDAVDLNPIVRIIDVKSNQPIDGTGDGDTSPDWEITGPLTLNLRAERAGNEDRKYTITVEAIDATGNRSVRTCEVKVSQPRGRAVR